nr:translation initiation factor III [uncultured Actinoplanes sp.]
MVTLVVSVLAALWAVAMMTVPGRVGYVYFFTYAEYYLGVVSLVSLSITVMVGLVATDRLVLSIRQRVLLQSAHRTTGVIAVLSLVGHVWTKIGEKHIGIIDAFVPFLMPYNRLYIGLGTLSGWIMILVMWTGLARSRFVGRGAPWMWRGIHAISYLMWPIALVHGLSAGRPAKPWVIVSYIVCILAVLVGLAVRLSVRLNRRKDFASTAASGGMKPVGKLVPTNAAPVTKKARRREERVEELGPVAVVDSFQPAANLQPVMAPPVVEAEPGYFEDLVAPRQRRGDDAFDEPTGLMSRRALDFDEDERPRGRRYAEQDIEYDEPAPRGRRYAPEDTGTRMRRPDLEDTSTRLRRSELEDTSTRLRRAEMEDTRYYEEAPAPRQRRYAEDEPVPRARRRAEDRYDDAPRGRRHADPGDYDEMPRSRSPRYADDEPPRRGGRSESRYGGEAEDAPRDRRGRGADIDRADSGRHSRSGFVDLAADDDADYLPPDETPTLVDMASRRARKAAQQDSGRAQAGRGARRGGGGRRNDDVADDEYWSQLRGEAN